MVKDVLGDDTSTVNTSLVCSGIATEDETCSPDLLVVGVNLFVSPKKSVIDCGKDLLALYNLIVLFAFHVAFNSTNPHVK